MNPLELLCRRAAYKKDLAERRQRLHRVAYAWCGDSTLADDLTQEALTKAYKNLGQLREPRAMDKWIYDILRNCWIDHLRRRRNTEDIDDLDARGELSYTEAPENEEVLQRVREAVAHLPAKQREVLALVDLEGFTYGEVADMLKVPLGTVTSRISRARETLRAQLIKDTRSTIVPLRRVV